MLHLFLINICYIKDLCCSVFFCIIIKGCKQRRGSRNIWSRNSSSDTNVTEMQSNHLSSMLFIQAFSWGSVVYIRTCLQSWVPILGGLWFLCLVVLWKMLWACKHFYFVMGGLRSLCFNANNCHSAAVALYVSFKREREKMQNLLM